MSILSDKLTIILKVIDFLLAVETNIKTEHLLSKKQILQEISFDINTIGEDIVYKHVEIIKLCVEECLKDYNVWEFPIITGFEISKLEAIYKDLLAKGEIEVQELSPENTEQHPETKNFQ